MDFRHVRAFIAVADAESVTRAAERLHISQPPLSRQIQQLEQELGVSLFSRHRHGVALTEAGRSLLEKARAWDRAASDFAEAAHRMQETQASRVRVGVGWGLWDLVNRSRVAFAAEAPGVRIDATDAFCYWDSDELLRTDQLDVAFARPPFHPEFEVSPPLVTEPIQVIMPATSALAGRPSVSLSDIAHVPLLQWERRHAPVLFDQIAELYRRAGIVPQTIETPGAGPFNLAGVMLVASGQGVYLGYGVPLQGPHPSSGVAMAPLSDAGATVEVCLVSRRDPTPTVRRFLDCARQEFGFGAPVGARRAS